jgi:hypothetical protein
MPFATQPRAEQATQRDKRRIALAGIALLAVIAAVAIWSAVKPGAYGASSHGCITVTLPSSTGGALIHQCGAAAKATCKHAFAAGDKVSLLTRPQCRLAGLAPQTANG